MQEVIAFALFVGTLYGFWKLYQYGQSRKADKARKATPSTRDENGFPKQK